MRLSHATRLRRKAKAISKTKTDLAVALAHIETLTAANAGLTETVSKLHDTIMVHAKARDANERSIALFKQEALHAAVREAELRGYIQRTLEDDAAREPAPVDQQDCIVQTRFEPRNATPARSGPGAMHSRPIFMGVDLCGQAGCDTADYAVTNADRSPINTVAMKRNAMFRDMLNWTDR